MEKYDQIVLIADKVLMACPNNDKFIFAEMISRSNLSEAEKDEAITEEEAIRNFLVNQKQYAVYSRPMFPTKQDPSSYNLTDLGRIVKEAGGHTKYSEKKKATEKEKNEIALEKEKYDTLTKKWTYKTRFLSVIALVISALALIIALFTYLQKEKEIKRKQDANQEVKNDISNKTKIATPKLQNTAK